MKNNLKQSFSKDFIKYKNKLKRNKILIVFCQISLLLILIGLWELFAYLQIIDTFIFSSPSKIVATTIDLFKNGNLTYHIGVTPNAAMIGLLIASIGGSFIAILLWWNETIRKILDPYIVVLNSLPKIALGPMIIVWVGTGIGSIIVMDILIMIVITIISMLNSFVNCDENKIMLLKSMGAKKYQILFKLILPNSLLDFISVLKINVGLTWVGTIMGEYLVSRAGLGYLIVYGGQVFKLDLVMASTIILCILAALMYFIVALIEKILYKTRGIS